mgnify:CR=1 FL=1
MIIKKLQNKNWPVSRTLLEADWKLIIKGQGTVVLPSENHPFSIYLSNSRTENFSGFGLTVDENHASFYHFDKGKKTLLSNSERGTGLDPDRECLYWFSFDSFNSCLRYGKGEQRQQTTIMKYLMPKSSAELDSNWIKSIEHIHICGVNPEAKEIRVWREPVTIEPPLLILPQDAIAMEMVAKYEGTVAENLTSECQKLYANVAGKQFQLNTPDFPCFSDAIEKSIRDPQGWCYQTLRKKAEEFGKTNSNATYLRITLGMNQGESPGIPYVLEIWPSGHYSPIHNHAGANAIIKVLHGKITVRLFNMLSIAHQTPFKTVILQAGDITWITRRLNQTHQLHNEDPNSVCITIQCYLYNIEENSHYEYFDYIDNSGKEIRHFFPNSDMDFLDFKEQMKQEWQRR